MAKRTTKKRPKKADAPDIPSGALAIDPPLPLTDIVGQSRAVDTLTHAADSGRLHHAWIFHGPEGVGKFTTALAWAAMLLDPDVSRDLSGTPVTDPASSTQKLIKSGTHPDLFVIKKELARYADDKRVRDQKLATIPKDVVTKHLIEPARLAPTIKNGANASRVFIVDEAELLDRSPTNAPVQNAILKTLEEPAPGVVIILVTSSEDRLLPTIRSRCQRVAFAPIDDDAMDRWASARGIDTHTNEHAWLRDHAAGSPGRYLWAHDEGLHAWADEILPQIDDAMRGTYPIALGSRMTSLVDDWAKDWVKRGEKVGEHRSKDAANRVGASRMLALLADHGARRLRDQRTTPAALRLIDAVHNARRDLSAHVQMRFVMDHLCAQISEPQPATAR